MSYYAVILDIVELLITMNIDYTSIDPNASFFKITLTRFNKLLTTPTLIAPYFATRLFRYWTHLNEILQLKQLNNNENWVLALESTGDSKLIVFISKIAYTIDLSPECLLSPLELLINKDDAQNRYSPSTFTLKDSDCYTFIDILFSKCYMFKETYKIILKLVTRYTLNGCSMDHSFLSHVFSKLLNLFKNFDIPLEDIEICESIVQIRNILIKYDYDVNEEISSVLFDYDFLQQLFQPKHHRFLFTILLLSSWYFDLNSSSYDNEYRPTLCHQHSSISSYQLELILTIQLINLSIKSKLINQLMIHCLIHVINSVSFKIKKFHEKYVSSFLESVKISSPEDKIIDPALFITYSRFITLLQQYYPSCIDSHTNSSSILLIDQLYGNLLDNTTNLINLIEPTEEDLIIQKIYSTLFDNKLVYDNSRIKNVDASKISQSFIKFINIPLFKKYCFVEMIRILVEANPTILKYILSSFRSITWIYTSEDISIAVEFDFYLNQIIKTDETILETVRNLVPEICNFTKKMLKNYQMESDINQFILKDIVDNKYPLINEISAATSFLKSLDESCIKSLPEIYEIHSIMNSSLLTNSLIENSNEDNIDLLLNWVSRPVCKFIKNLVNDMMNIEIENQQNPCYLIHQRLLPILRVIGFDVVYSVLKTLRQLIFPEAVYKIVSKVVKIHFHEFYIFSMLVASFSFQDTDIPITVIIQAYQTLSLSLQNIDNSCEYNKIELLLLSLCISNIYQFFLHTYPNIKNNENELNYNINTIKSRDMLNASFQLHQLVIKINLFDVHQPIPNSFTSSLSSSVFTATLKSFLYHISRHPFFYFIVRIPTNILPLLFDVSGDDSLKQISNLPYIPTDMFKRSKDIKEFIIRYLKLGWTSKQSYMECVMCLLNLISITVSNETYTKKKKHKFLSILFKGTSHLIQYTQAFPKKGDPLFSLTSLSSKILFEKMPLNASTVAFLSRFTRNTLGILFDINKRSIFPTIVNDILYNSIFDVNFASTENSDQILVSNLPYQRSYLLYPFPHDFISHYFNPTTRNTLFSHTNINCDIIPIVRPLLDSIFSVLSSSDLIEISPNDHLWKSLYILCDYIIDERDFHRIVQLFSNINHDNVVNDETYFKYYLLLLSRSLSVIGDHKIKKPFISNLVIGLSHSNKIIKLCSYLSLLHIYPYPSFLPVSIKNNINRMLLQEISMNEVSRISSRCSFMFEKVMIIEIIVFLTLRTPESPQSLHISEVIPLLFDFISDPAISFHNSTRRHIWLCYFYCLLHYEPNVTFKRHNLSSIYRSELWEVIVSYILIGTIDENTNMMFGEHVEVMTELIQKISKCDLILSNEWSRMFRLFIISFIDIEDIFGRIFTALFENQSRDNSFINILKHLISYADSNSITIRKNIWLTHALSFINNSANKNVYFLTIIKIFALFSQYSQSLLDFTLLDCKNQQYSKILFNHLTTSIHRRLRPSEDFELILLINKFNEIIFKTPAQLIDVKEHEKHCN